MAPNIFVTLNFLSTDIKYVCSLLEAYIRLLYQFHGKYKELINKINEKKLFGYVDDLDDDFYIFTFYYY